MTTGKSNRVFIALMITSLLAAVFDIWAVTLDNQHSADVASLYMAHTCYLLFHTLSVPSYIAFTISLADMWHKIRKRPLLVVAFSIPYTVLVLSLIVNFFTGAVFSVENGYTRGPLFIILYIATAFYFIIGICFLIYCRSLFSFARLFAIGMVIPVQIVALAVQFIMPEQLLEIFANAIGVLFITMTIQRPEMLIDSFTGLLKHSAYAEHMKLRLKTGKHCNIVMLNIANFSVLHTMLSFDNSTKLIAIVADELKEINRKLRNASDIYYLDRGRYRMVFPENKRSSAEVAAELLNRKLRRRMNVNGFNVSLTPFVCLARYPDEIPDFPSLMSFGLDFHEKNSAPDRVVLAPEIFDYKRLALINSMDSIIDRALENKSFQVYYQPIYSVEKKRFTSAEALLRLFDEEHGFISPELVITAAEKSGAINKIGEYVLEQVCDFISGNEFRNLGIEYIEVNLSVGQCMNEKLSKNILEIMNRYNVSSDKINLEITETAASYSQKVMSDNLSKLRAAGITFSLDDYGTGYSNIKRVIELPLKIVKLDKSFVDGQNNPKMWIVLQGTVKMLKDMDMQLVVEGVETKDMLDKFAALHCDYIQGYYFSKPIPKNDFVEFIRNSNDTRDTQ